MTNSPFNVKVVRESNKPLPPAHGNPINTTFQNGAADPLSFSRDVLTPEGWIIQRTLTTLVEFLVEFDDDNEKKTLLSFANLGMFLRFFNVSAGLKPFLTIKRLLEYGHIRNNDILILDEPEANLHPEWQLKFAELIIILQKELDITILLATHSPYFLEAIEVFSKKHKISQKS